MQIDTEETYKEQNEKGFIFSLVLRTTFFGNVTRGPGGDPLLPIISEKAPLSYDWKKAGPLLSIIMYGAWYG